MSSICGPSLEFYNIFFSFIYLYCITPSRRLREANIREARVSAVLVEEMLLKIKVPTRFVSWSGLKDDRVKMLKVRNRLTVIG